MKRFLCFTVLLLFLFSQDIKAQQVETKESKKDFERAKEEMLYNDESPDYAKARKILANVVTKDSANAEAWYFYGYALDKTNAADGERMLNVQLSQTIKASEAFEKSLKLSGDIYKGELVLFDPHTKILSVWGSQAIRYLYEDKRDSAIYCFEEAVRRDGINRAVAKYFQCVLDECPKNALLFTNGDMYLFYLTYLQVVEKYRMDVKCIDINLLNTKWYPIWLLERDMVAFSYHPDELEKVDIGRWTAAEVTIKNAASENNSDMGFSWRLSPTYDKKYLLRSDKLLLDILQQNAFKYEVLFPGDVPPNMQLFLTDYLYYNGLTYKLINNKESSNDLDGLEKKLKILKPLPSGASNYLHSKDNIQVLNNYRFAYTSAAELALKDGNTTMAKRLIESVERKFPEDELPFFAESTKKWFYELKEKIIKMAGNKNK